MITFLCKKVKMHHINTVVWCMSVLFNWVKLIVMVICSIVIVFDKVDIKL